MLVVKWNDKVRRTAFRLYQLASTPRVEGTSPLLYSGEGQGEGLFEPQSVATLSKKNGHRNPASQPRPLDPCLAISVTSEAF